MCGRRRRGRRTPEPRGGCWRSRCCWKAGRESLRRRLAPWIARRCGTGYIATMPLGWPGCTTRRAATGRRLAFQANKGPRWRNGWRKVLISRDGVVRWRCVDLRQRIKQEFAVELHERTIGKLLRKLAFRRLSVRPQHPQSEPEEQVVFKAGLPIS